MTGSLLAVSLHDVEHHTLDRCRQIRDWLFDRGVQRTTLLVIPSGRDGLLVPDDDCATWLRRRQADGDAIAQHGMHHRRRRPASRAREWLADRQGGAAAEFVGLTWSQTVSAVDDGRSLLQWAGLTPRGFVAPAYAYTRALRRVVKPRFPWYADLFGVHGARRVRAPAHGLGTSTAFKRHSSPVALQIGARLPTRVLRIDVHPGDFDLPRHVDALDAVLRAASRRRPVTYDDLTA